MIRSTDLLALGAVVLSSSALACLGAAVPAAADGPPPCTTSWTGAGSNNFADPASWSNGSPDGSSVACIDQAGTYTVDITQPITVGTLLMQATAGSQTVKVIPRQTPFGGSVTTPDAGLSVVGSDQSIIGSNAVVELGGNEYPSSQTAPTGIASFETTGPLLNAGSILTDTTAADAATAPELIADGGDWTNQGIVHVATPTEITGGGTVTNDGGKIQIDNGNTLIVDGQGTTLDNDSGTVGNPGTLLVSEGSVFQQGDGVTTGFPIEIGGTVDFTGNGASDFAVNDGSIEGSTVSGQDITVDPTLVFPGSFADTTAQWTAPATVGGDLTLAGTTVANESATLNISGSGALTVAADGSLTTDAQSTDFISGNLSNSGLIDLQGQTIYDGGTFTNNAQLSVENSLTGSGSSVITNGDAGLITNGGVIQATAFHEDAGSVSGNAVNISPDGLIAFDGTGSIEVETLGTATVDGSVAPDQTLQIDSETGAATVSFPTAFTNAGTIDIGYSSDTYPIDLSVGGTGILTNTGTINAGYDDPTPVDVVKGSITNQGSLGISDDGTFTGGDSFKQTGSGQLTVGVSEGNVSLMTIRGAARLNGNLVVEGVQNQTTASKPIIQAASISGTFSSVTSQNPALYKATYTSTAVTIAEATSSSLAVTGAHTTIYGKKLTLKGQLDVAQTTKPISGGTVLLMRSVADGRKAQQLASRTTDSAGAVAFTVTPTANATYTLVYNGDPNQIGAAVSCRNLVVPVVTIKASTSKAKAGTSVILTGSVKPAHKRAKLWLQQAVNHLWKTIHTFTEGSAGAYSVTATITARGQNMFRVAAPKTKSLITGVSSAVQIKGH